MEAVGIQLMHVLCLRQYLHKIRQIREKSQQFNSIPFLICLRGEVNTQGPITHSGRIQNDNNKNKHIDREQIRKKPNNSMLLKFKHMF
jgi:hypothetical protein